MEAAKPSFWIQRHVPINEVGSSNFPIIITCPHRLVERSQAQRDIVVSVGDYPFEILPKQHIWFELKGPKNIEKDCRNASL